MAELEFDLVDGRRARVFWVNGPPYLTVSYGTLVETNCGCAGKAKDCKSCNGSGTFQRRVWKGS